MRAVRGRGVLQGMVVIGGFVLDLSGSIQRSALRAGFGFEYGDGTSGDITQETESIEGSRLNTTTSAGDWAAASTFVSDPDGSTVAEGETATSVLDTATWDGRTVRVVWESDDRKNSATPSPSTAPS